MMTLSQPQMEQLTELFRCGASDASQALSVWLGRHASVCVDQLKQLNLDEATKSLGPADATLCACIMGVTGGISGQMLFCFDEESGLLLCDLLLGRDGVVGSDGVATEWGELETSSAMETANIVGCAYLNSLANAMPSLSSPFADYLGKTSHVWVPTPPQFVRDFAASILQFAVMNQAAEFDTVLVAQTRFQIDDQPVAWTLLLIPDANSLTSIINSTTAPRP
jgi:chemotaxis protein CheC